MAPEAVLQLREPGLHQSQREWACDPARSAILDSRAARGPITEWEAGEGGAGPAARAHVAARPALPATCARARPLSSCSCSSQTPLQPVARGLVSVCRLGQPQWGLSGPRRGPPLRQDHFPRVQRGQPGLCWGVRRPGVLIDARAEVWGVG